MSAVQQSVPTKPNYLAINFLWLGVTLLVFCLLVKLGFWQTNRAQEKTERLDRIQSLVNQQALSLDDIVKLNSQGDEIINDLPVKLSGQFNHEVIFLLDNQMFNGKFGYRVLQLLTTNHTKHAVLINLGWIEGDRTRQTQPNIEVLTGEVELTGHVRLIEQGIMLTEQNFEPQAWPMLIQQIEINKMAELIGVELLPFVIYLDKKESLGYQKNWQPIVMPPEKHQGYAFQWFSLAIAWLLLMIWAARKAQLAKQMKASQPNRQQ